MKDIRIKEELVKIGMKLEEIKEDIQELKKLEERISELERQAAFAKGFTGVATMVVGGIISFMFLIVQKIGLL